MNLVLLERHGRAEYCITVEIILEKRRIKVEKKKKIFHFLLKIATDRKF